MLGHSGGDPSLDALPDSHTPGARGSAGRPPLAAEVSQLPSFVFLEIAGSAASLFQFACTLVASVRVILFLLFWFWVCWRSSDMSPTHHKHTRQPNNAPSFHSHIAQSSTRVFGWAPKGPLRSSFMGQTSCNTFRHQCTHKHTQQQTKAQTLNATFT
jgi:ABC-type nickel/cobalt efflux system permease component RcnA